MPDHVPELGPCIRIEFRLRANRGGGPSGNIGSFVLHKFWRNMLRAAGATGRCGRAANRFVAWAACCKSSTDRCRRCEVTMQDHASDLRRAACPAPVVVGDPLATAALADVAARLRALRAWHGRAHVPAPPEAPPSMFCEFDMGTPCSGPQNTQRPSASPAGNSSGVGGWWTRRVAPPASHDGPCHRC